MVRITGLFEAHVNVVNLDRAIAFYRDVLGLPLAARLEERRVAFFWVGAPGQAMLGVWETGTSPMRTIAHTAFTVTLDDVLAAPKALEAAGITPLDLAGKPTPEPVVLAWMPAASIYFQDPDGNLLEFLCMLPDAPDPARGIVPWSAWA